MKFGGKSDKLVARLGGWKFGANRTNRRASFSGKWGSHFSKMEVAFFKMGCAFFKIVFANFRIEFAFLKNVNSNKDIRKVQQ